MAIDNIKIVPKTENEKKILEVLNQIILALNQNKIFIKLPLEQIIFSDEDNNTVDTSSNEVEAETEEELQLIKEAEEKANKPENELTNKEDDFNLESALEDDTTE